MAHDRRLSKRLSFVLRHRPDAVGLVLDEQGWVAVDDLLRALRVDRTQLERVVAENDKQRFELVEDRIRARQGHSVAVDLGLQPVEPPDVLWHGTSAASVEAIRREGLRPGGRTHVHLSPDPETARRVGARHGPPVVLRVDAGRAARDGHEFRLSGNGVWLTGPLPPAYLS